MTARSLVARAWRRIGQGRGAVSRFACMAAGFRDGRGALWFDNRRQNYSPPHLANLLRQLNTLRCRAALGLLFLPLAQVAMAQVTVPVGGSVSIPAGGLFNLGCIDLNVQGGVALDGAGQIGASTLNIAATGTVQGGAGTIALGGHWNNLGSFVAGSSTVILNHGCGIDPVQLSGNTVFHNLTLTSATGGTFVIPAGHGTYVNGTLTLQGIGLPIQVASSSAETAFITRGGALVSSNATLSPGVRLAMSLSPAIFFLLLD